jgi:hypothetical protein
MWLVIYLNCTMMHGLTNLKFEATSSYLWGITLFHGASHLLDVEVKLNAGLP